MRRRNIAISILMFGQGHLTQACNFYKHIKEQYKIVALILILPVDMPMTTAENTIKSTILFEDNPFVSFNPAVLSTSDDCSTLWKCMIDVAIISNGFKPTFINICKDTHTEFHISFWGFNWYDSIPTLGIARQSISLYPNCFLLKSFYSNFNNQIHYVPIIVDNEEEIKSNSIYVNSIPPLINTARIERNITNKTCLLYLRDAEYLCFLPGLVKNNPDFTFNVFTIWKGGFSHKNITYHAVGPKFKDHMKTASCMITSSGNETIQECVYNEIPIAIFKPTTDFEQRINYNIYVRNGMALPFSENIDLCKLQNYKYKDTVKFQRMVENAPAVALSLMNRLEASTL